MTKKIVFASCLCTLKTVCIILSVMYIFSCASSKNIQIEKLDYTDEDVRLNEIAEIKKIEEKEPIQALWRAYCVVSKISTDYEVNFLNTQIENVLKLYDEAINSKKYELAIRYGQSLEYVIKSFDFLHTDFNFSYDDLAQKRNHIELQNHVENVSDVKLSSFIKGTVTVWLDLGVKVEKGMGYPDRVIGSGFFIDKKGYIITNYHVIASEVDPEYEGYSRLYIKLADDPDTRIPAKVIGWDSALDLALLKTEVDSPYVFSLGTSSDLDVGDRIYAIGSPVGLDRTLTAGIVSATDRKLFSIGSVLQLDAAVNAGSSGGPIIDEQGRVKGIVFAGMMEYEGLNFAIPVEYVKYNLPSFFDGGEIKHSWFGVYGETKKDIMNKNESIGVSVLYVVPGSFAFKGGLSSGDVITDINNIRVTSLDELKTVLLKSSVDSIVSVSFINEAGEKKTSLFYLDERPKNPGFEVYTRDVLSSAFYPLFGMKLIPTDTRNSKVFSIESVLKGSIADEGGFSEHDPIQIEKTRILEKNSIIYTEIYTKKRKSGYLNVSLAISAPMDSSSYF